MLALDLLSLFTTAAAVEDIGHHLLVRTPACPLFHNQVHFSTFVLVFVFVFVLVFLFLFVFEYLRI